MFTRTVAIHTKRGKGKELSTVMNEKVLPLLRRQPGFVDEITLVSSTNPDQMLALSFWQSEHNAKEYNTTQFSTIRQIVDPFLDSPPTVKTFNVDTSTFHKIALGKAA
jgi:heme-degrading monooxygenase HmoA